MLITFKYDETAKTHQLILSACLYNFLIVKFQRNHKYTLESNPNEKTIIFLCNLFNHIIFYVNILDQIGFIACICSWINVSSCLISIMHESY